MHEQDIINGLSYHIAQAKRQLYGEYCVPGLDADASDDLIKKLRSKVQSLRDIREALETIFYGEGEV